MTIVCPYCDMEVKAGDVEAEDGYCPECGVFLSATSVFRPDEDDGEDLFDDLDDLDESDEDLEFGLSDDYSDTSDLDRLYLDGSEEASNY